MMRIRHSRAQISADFPPALRYLSRPARAPSRGRPVACLPRAGPPRRVRPCVDAAKLMPPLYPQ
ncbi:hypothetical protein EMIT0158MI4_50397 [Burkholderia ambifaria]